MVGRRDVEDALQRLDQLTQEEARMAASELLKITRGIESKVDSVDDQVRGVDGRVGLVIKGILFLPQLSPESVLTVLPREA